MVLGFLWIFLLGLDIFLVLSQLPCLQFTTRCNPLEERQVSARQRSRRLCHNPKIFQEDCGSMESESTWPVALPLNVQPNPRKLQEPDSQLSRAQLPSTYSPWTSWRADNPGGTCTQLLGLVDSAPSMTSSLRPVANRTLLLVVGGAGRVVSTPNRRVSKCFSRNKPPGLLSGPVFWTAPHEALFGRNRESTTSPLNSASTNKVWQLRQSSLEYLRRSCLLRCRQSKLISVSTVGETFDQGAGRVDSAPGRSPSLALHPGIAVIVMRNGQVLTVGRVVSTPKRSVDQRYSRRTPPWLLSGPAFWTVPHKALIGQNPASAQPALQPASPKVRQPRQNSMAFLQSRCLLRRWKSSLALASTVEATFDQGTGRGDSAPGRLLSPTPSPAILILVMPNGQVLITGRVVSTPRRREGFQPLKSETPRGAQANNYTGGSYAHRPMQEHAHSSPCRVLSLSRSNQPRRETNEPSNLLAPEHILL